MNSQCASKQDNLPRIVLIGRVGKIVDMSWIWEVFGILISFQS